MWLECTKHPTDGLHAMLVLRLPPCGTGVNDRRLTALANGTAPSPAFCVDAHRPPMERRISFDIRFSPGNPYELDEAAEDCQDHLAAIAIAIARRAGATAGRHHAVTVSLPWAPFACPDLPLPDERVLETAFDWLAHTASARGAPDAALAYNRIGHRCLLARPHRRRSAWMSEMRDLADGRLHAWLTAPAIDERAWRRYTAMAGHGQVIREELHTRLSLTRTRPVPGLSWGERRIPDRIPSTNPLAAILPPPPGHNTHRDTTATGQPR